MTFSLKFLSRGRLVRRLEQEMALADMICRLDRFTKRRAISLVKKIFG
jgi:hypothetical protein